MPTKKPTAKKPKAAPKKAAAKKAPAKKAAPKKAVAKKAAPAPAPPPAPAPAPVKFNPVHMYVLTNVGEYNLSFSDKAMYEAAMDCISTAPSNTGGSRNPKVFTLTSDSGSMTFTNLIRHRLL